MLSSCLPTSDNLKIQIQASTSDFIFFFTHVHITYTSSHSSICSSRSFNFLPFPSFIPCNSSLGKAVLQRGAQPSAGCGCCTLAEHSKSVSNIRFMYLYMPKSQLHTDGHTSSQQHWMVFFPLCSHCSEMACLGEQGPQSAVGSR